MLAALALVSGAACSGSGPESAQDPSAGEVSSSGAGSDDSATVGDEALAAESADPEGADPDGAEGDDAGGDSGQVRGYPLEAFIAEMRAELFPEQHAIADWWAAKDQMTQECMADHGLRYELRHSATDAGAEDAETAAEPPGPSEEDVDAMVAFGGYGLADSLLYVPGAVESDDSYVDLNEVIRDGLSASERKAWDRQRADCHFEVSKWFEEPDIVTWQFELPYQALFEGIRADPRLVAAIASWPECMAQRGHSYDSQDAIHQYLNSIAGPLRSRLRALGGPDRIDAEFQADLDAFRALEADIAVADVACSDRVEQVIREVRFEHEQRFLDENQARMAALLREGSPTITAPASYEEVQRLWVCAPTRSEPGPQCMPSRFAGEESLRW